MLIMLPEAAKHNLVIISPAWQLGGHTWVGFWYLEVCIAHPSKENMDSKAAAEVCKAAAFVQIVGGGMGSLEIASRYTECCRGIYNKVCLYYSY